MRRRLLRAFSLKRTFLPLPRLPPFLGEDGRAGLSSQPENILLNIFLALDQADFLPAGRLVLFDFELLRLRFIALTYRIRALDLKLVSN